jgi:hypothetical protein
MCQPSAAAAACWVPDTQTFKRMCHCSQAGSASNVCEHRTVNTLAPSSQEKTGQTPCCTLGVGPRQAAVQQLQAGAPLLLTTTQPAETHILSTSCCEGATSRCSTPGSNTTSAGDKKYNAQKYTRLALLCNLDMTYWHSLADKLEATLHSIA